MRRCGRWCPSASDDRAAVTSIAFLRHGPTAWTRARRLQGRADPPLDAGGRAAVSGWRLPPEARAWHWRTSPLARCVETAALLGLAAKSDARLIEMDWGEWEGRRVADLAKEGGDAFAVLESRGRDLRAPGGESPREVQARLAPLLAEIAEGRQDCGAVSHKGVIRAMLSLATGWSMGEDPPAELAWNALHVFSLDRSGRPRVERLNWMLAAR